MADTSYLQRRGQLETYFDRTAAQTWARLTSTDKVSRIRETVRAGRDRMRATLLDWLPQDLRGRRLLDAGCGTGALAVEAARRGADVLAIDLSAKLVDVARARLPSTLGAGSIEFFVGDMLDSSFGRFDHAVCMDSLIHYHGSDIVDSLERLAARTSGSLLFTFAPKTPLLTAMHRVGKLFPQGDRAPAIVPVSRANLDRLFAARPALAGWRTGRSERIKSGFYTSQALELVRR
ncbi:MAG: magnesium protoporphyrin IX methyltransferase [Nevskia sp.]